VVSGGKEVGELTSVAELPIGANKRIALGYIRREVGTPGRQVMVGSISATVVQLPLMQDASANHDTSLEQRPA
jgi:glycine cleavage system aminomethyltransferase T